jgi:hypothetical protein
MFRLQPGKTLDLRPHHHLYALDKNLSWEAPRKPSQEAKDKD